MSRAKLWILALALTSCSALDFRYPLEQSLTKKHFEPRRAPEQIELYFSGSRTAKTFRSGGSHSVGEDEDGYFPPIVDSGMEEVARSFPVPGAPRRKPGQAFLELRKLRSNLVPAEARETVEAPQWQDEAPAGVLPTDEMIDEGIAQLQEMGARVGADAVTDVFLWVVVEESRFGVGGVYDLRVVPLGVVVQGTAIRYEDR